MVEDTLLIAGFFLTAYALHAVHARTWPPQKKGAQEMWSLFGSSMLAGTSIAVVCGDAKSLRFSATDFSETTMSVRMFLAANTSWYLHDVWLESSEWDTSMCVHHGITFVLISGAYALRAQAKAFSVLFLTSLSTPFLYVSKLFRLMSMPMLFQRIAFLTFASVFAITRILMFPYLVVRAVLLLDDVSLPSYVVFNAMTLTLYGLQWLWFLKIARILFGAWLLRLRKE